MNIYLLKMMLFGGNARKNSPPLKTSILDLSEQTIKLIYKHLGAKEKLVGEDLCRANDSFSLAMTCTRLRKIFQSIVRCIDGREPCTNYKGDRRCTCRSSHELEFKAFVTGPALTSIQLPKITFRSINSVLESFARFCPHIAEVSFNDNELLEQFTMQYFCNRWRLESVSVRNPSKRLLEVLRRSRSRFSKLILTEIKPSCVPAVRDLIRSRSSTLKVLNASVCLEGFWSRLDGFVAVEILCNLLITAADDVVEAREKYGPPIEIFEISGSPVCTRQIQKGVRKKIYLPTGQRSFVNEI